MQTINKPIFQAHDGKQFDSELDCQRHEVKLAVGERFPDFIKRSGYSDRTLGVIEAWEMFNAKQANGEPLLAQFKAPTSKTGAGTAETQDKLPLEKTDA